MTFGSEVSIADGLEYIGTILQPVARMPQIHQSMYDVLNNTSIARFCTIPNHARACRSFIYTCGDMRPCSGTDWLVRVLNGKP